MELVKGYGQSRIGLDHHGFVDCGEIHWNLPAAELYEHALCNQEALLASNGAIVCRTGKFTGRSPNDKFFVDEPGSHEQIAWGKSNRPMSEAHFDALLEHMLFHCRGRRLYVRDMFAGADESTRLPIRVITELAWHNLFASQLFIRPATGSTTGHEPQFTVICVPSCQADPSIHGTNSKSFIVAHLSKGLVLIGGTSYAGEIKKSIFTVMNYILPTQGVLSMHCSANVGRADDVALFFGLSGTGKTTLSADPERRLIGDDEHGWSDQGVFNIEGGCYAKCIRLSPQLEPQIYRAIRFGAVLENVAMDDATRTIDYHSSMYTENTRAAYPLEHIEDAVLPSVGGHPRNVVFLTCDAFGVLPPIAKLSQHHAMYHFLSGYTAKVAGTEAGVTEPQATFSACFSAPFIPLAAERYATMLGEKLARHKVDCWLVNTGWSGGGVGVGKRISLRYTRALVTAALAGRLNNVPTTPDPVFGIMVPQRCPDVPTELLTPRSTWPDPVAYDSRARHLAELFKKNFTAFKNVSENVAAAGPQVGSPVRA